MEHASKRHCYLHILIVKFDIWIEYKCSFLTVETVLWQTSSLKVPSLANSGAFNLISLFFHQWIKFGQLSWNWLNCLQVIVTPVSVQGCSLAVWSGKRSMVINPESVDDQRISLNRDRSYHLPSFTTTCSILRLHDDNWVNSTLWGRLKCDWKIQKKQVSERVSHELRCICLFFFVKRQTCTHFILDNWGMEIQARPSNPQDPKNTVPTFLKWTSEPWWLPHQLEMALSSSPAVLPPQEWIWKEHTSFRPYGHTSSSDLSTSTVNLMCSIFSWVK